MTRSAGEPVDRHLIVGLGASAGGLNAYRAFLSNMPADSGMSFILVQHLDPVQRSALVSILADCTTMPVEPAENDICVRPNRVYVTPPDAILTIRGGRLQLSSAASAVACRASINSFLGSLAKDQGRNAVGIILSGMGSDGALGIAAIKEGGGLTLSQAEPDQQAKSAMPQSAALGGFVDHFMAVEEMPAALIAYRSHQIAADAACGPDGLRRDLPARLPAIFAVLHSKLGHDFSQYKTGTLMRRIQRRLGVLRVDTVDAYIEQLRVLPHEAELLFRELLIGVTSFFRDREAFESLESVIIDQLFADPSIVEPVRVWIAGCATGEEAYSIAILLKEATLRSESQRPVQIFATDMDEQAIETARAGVYHSPIAADLSTERLERNFVQEDGHYRIGKDLREMCLFSTHDLAKDPPFSRLDLVSCRNLLIYFDSRLQERVLSTFHYALRPGRFLLLGSSESVGSQSRLFDPLDRRQRLYVRRDGAASFQIQPPQPQAEDPPAVARTPVRAGDEIDRLAARAMGRHAPAFLVVDQKYDILRFSGQTGRYLEPATGIASLNLFALLHADLRTVVRNALKQVVTTGEPVLRDRVTIDSGTQYELVRLIVEPLAHGQDLFVVGFQDAGPAPIRHGVIPPGARPDIEGAGLLERELRATQERLRELGDELVTANEELQSSREEYLSVNEELQSANEELETSKEELQSLNEELQAFNAELNQRNDSLVRANSDLGNLFDSTSIATLFLDNALRIRRFTPRLLEIFKVREGDEGRPITDIVTRLTRDSLGQDVQHVLSSLAPLEREVALDDGQISYLMQVRPYRDQNEQVDGAVITFVDISERKRHEAARARLAAIVESSQDAIISHDVHGIVVSWNASAERLYGYGAAEAIGQPVTLLLHDILTDDWAAVLARLQLGELIARFDQTRIARDGTPVEVAISISAVRQPDGQIIGASVVARDISQRKSAERRAALLLGELDHRVRNILAIVSAVVTQTPTKDVLPAMFVAEIEGRIMAIAEAHSLVTRSGTGEMSLAELLVTELAPYRRDLNVTIAGPEFAVVADAGLALALAVHELASNAAKYGALSTETGRLVVAWDMTGSSRRDTLRLVWTETDGPPVTAPVCRGFGTTLIERALAYGFGAVVEREFAPSGLVCVIEIPITDETGRLVLSPAQGRSRP